MKRVLTFAFLIAAASAFAPCAKGEPVRLDKERFMDKCKGAWLGQMFAVCYGDIYEFKFNTKTIDEPLRPWTPELMKGAIDQDDCYVEMTFLKTLVDYGLDVSPVQAGKDFADSKYPLWHANKFARENLRKGLIPPYSGYPEYNLHADDIDFQIEADVFGIITPGLPLECNRLTDLFGHIMNYGDGVYGGMFVAGMYSAAYFEDNDVRAVVEAGLECIPKESLYYQCMADTIRWCDEHPDDWRATWQKLEEKWQDDVDCQPGDPVNIDAKINGAYIVMGLLYGKGDIMRTAEVSTRCGQDADCNPSNAVGVLGCMKGFSGFPEDITSGVDEIKGKNFSFTEYSFDTLIEACREVAEKAIVRNGGTIENDAYLIPVQKPAAPARLEQWMNQAEMIGKN